LNYLKYYKNTIILPAKVKQVNITNDLPIWKINNITSEYILLNKDAKQTFASRSFKKSCIFIAYFYSSILELDNNNNNKILKLIAYPIIALY